MNILINWLLSAFAILVSAYLLRDFGVRVDNFFTALVIALVLGIVNAILKPILIFLTLPINIFTLGLFTLVINALLIMLVAALVKDFSVDGFLQALIFGIVLSIISSILHKFF